MRICVIGTSHIAALKEADRQGWGRENGVELTFFGTPFALYQHLVVENGVLKGDEKTAAILHSTSEGRHETIDPAGFDGLVFHGADLRVSHLVSSIAERNVGKKLSFSRAFLREGIASWARNLMVFDHVSKLRRVSRTPFVVSPTPNPPRSQADDPDADDRLLAELRPWVEAELGKVFAAEGVTFVPQPAETRGGGFYTDEAFKTGAVRLNRSSEGIVRSETKVDRFHMNTAYGALVLRDALVGLSKRVG